METKKSGFIYGFVVAAIMVALAVLIHSFLLPFFSAGLDQREAAANNRVEEIAKLRKDVEAARKKFNATAAQPLAASLDYTPSTSGELFDHLQTAALLTRKVGSLTLRLQKPDATRAFDPLLGFLYPGMHFEKFTFDMEGALPDVIDYLQAEVESNPFAFYASFSASASSQKGSWPKYTFDVWFPTKKE